MHAAAETVGGHRDSRIIIIKKIQNAQRETPACLCVYTGCCYMRAASAGFIAFCVQQTAMTTSTVCLLYSSGHLGHLF